MYSTREDAVFFAEWVEALHSKKLSVNSITAYEQSVRHFLTFLAQRGVSVTAFRSEDRDEFIADLLRHRYRKTTVEDHVNRIRQFLRFHGKKTKVKSSTFSIHTVRRVFKGLTVNEIGLSHAGPDRKHDGMRRLGNPLVLKSAHNKFHPRG